VALEFRRGRGVISAMRLELLRRAVAAALVLVPLMAAPALAADSWLAPHDVSVGYASSTPGAAIGPDGTVTAAFVDGEGSQRALKVAVKPPGQPWRAPVQLSKPDGVAMFAYTASDRAGNVVVVWAEQLNGGFVVRGATKPAGGEFTPAQSISDTGTSANWPQVAMAGGTAVVAWAQNGRVRAATATAGGAFVVHDPLTPPIGFDDPPAVGVAPGGAAVVAWRTPGSGDGTAELHAAARAAGGEFAALPDVASVPTNSIHRVQIAMSPQGRATMAWTFNDSSADIGRLQSASRAVTGKFGGVETVANRSGEFALAMSDDDTALLAWADGTLRYAQRPLGGGFTVGSVPGSIAYESQVPRARYGADGAARLLWRGGPGPRESVQTARIAPDGTSGPPQTVSPPSEAPPAGQNHSLGAIDLGVDEQGDAVASWLHDYDAAPGPAFDTRTRVRTSVLDATPPAITDLRVAASASAGRAVAMSASAADALSATTTTWDFGDGGSAQGETVSKAFLVPGAYTVRVTATDGAGNTTTAQRHVRVRGRTGPEG
jgi:PKD domain